MGKNEFTVKVGDKDIVLKSVPITPLIREESDVHYSKAWNAALNAGLMLKIEVDRLLEDRNLLDLKKDNDKAFELRKQLKEDESRLRSAKIDGRKMTKQDGRNLAISMRKLRATLGEIGTNLNQYYNNTVESKADNERFQYFIYASTVYADSGQRYWKSFDAFKSESVPGLVEQATRGFLAVTAGLDKDYEKQFYENKWLIRAGFMDDKMRLVNDQGHLVDEDNRLIDENGRYVNSDGDFVDVYGNKIDKDGQLIMADNWEETPQESSKSSTPV